MATITEDYVSFKVAKLLREKGFKEPTLAYAYGQDMVAYYSQPKVTDDYSVEAGRYPLPTLQMAMKWLREVHKIFITILFIEDTNYFAYTIENLDTKKYLSTSKDISYNDYEEACEAAILYCLTNLI